MSSSKNASPTLEELAVEYATSGMKIIPLNNLGKPKEFKALLGLKSNDFGVCAFMGSSPSRVPGMKEVVRIVPEMLGKLDQQYSLDMPLISGGGNWTGIRPDESTGLMGEWAFGATRTDRTARFVITEGLMLKEGLPRKPGIAACLKQIPEEASDVRLGLRTDGLIEAGDLFLGFPGGLGTLVEIATFFTNLGIHHEFSKKKLLLIDPIFQDSSTMSAAPFWDLDVRSFKQKNSAGLISDRTAKIINDNCLVYRPDASLSPQQMCQEIVAITLAVRGDAPKIDPKAGYAPVAPAVMRQHCQALAPRTAIGHIFDNHPLEDRSWGNNLRLLSTKRAATPQP